MALFAVSKALTTDSDISLARRLPEVYSAHTRFSLESLRNGCWVRLQEIRNRSREIYELRSIPLRTMLVRAAVAALALGAASAVVAQTSALSQKATDASELLARARRDGSVRVIVLFQSPFSPTQVTPDAAGVAAVRSQVAAMQDSILSTHFGSTNPPASHGFDRGLTRFEITPGFALTVNSAELEALAGDSRIITIQLDRPVPPTAR